MTANLKAASDFNMTRTFAQLRSQFKLKTDQLQTNLLQCALDGTNKATLDLNSGVDKTFEKQSIKGQKNKTTEKDYKYAVTFVKLILERNHLTRDASLRNIETGVTANELVNADNAISIESKLTEETIGMNSLVDSFKRSEKAVPINTKPIVKTYNETIQRLPQKAVLLDEIWPVVDCEKRESVRTWFKL
ncbi:hypothetical protein CHS0354_013749 [Potamilus streckersoni]|uniref:Uncharacterized protein n=1 Tax=Potamilus streckersoni TaxID=2493646 RepID=A0AAE0VVK3_9BIVA|nr:hypothetical protein CHS0354_013749 [Potamilus streckersoni]